MPGEIIKVSGPLVVAINMPDVKMYDVVYVSDKKLIGEVVEIKENKIFIQVYEDTSGVGVGEPVYESGGPLTVELGPGLIGSIYDGIQRPLDLIRTEQGDFIARGIKILPLDRTKKWEFFPTVKSKHIIGGDILGYVDETPLVRHYILVPPKIKGEIIELNSGKMTIEDTVAKIKTDDGIKNIKMYQKWPVRIPRLVSEKLQPCETLFTGQRVIDTFFPIAKGGTSCVPGPFGSGKTVLQHQLAKWSDANIIVFVGCGERGNEMADVLIEFPELKDPKSGRPLMERTVLVANTSNMPVAAREASIYTGITIAEYFRDMGYSVGLMADSTSRWAEALREISGRLEEMPGEEGYPAYLPKRIAEFYERAGRVKCLGSDNRCGVLSVIGAVSPPGGDLSDPVVQATLKVVKVFWSLEDWLAHARHFPAINWLTSYSLYHKDLDEFYRKQLGEDFPELRLQAMALLQKESELKEIVRLVGYDALSEQDKLVLESAKSIREDFLYQSAVDPVDTYCFAKKQYLLLKLILLFYNLAKESLEKNKDFQKLRTLPIREKIAQARFIPENELYKFDDLLKELTEQIRRL